MDAEIVLRKELKDMKKVFKYFITILTFCIFAVKSYSQLSFSIDTLKISDVFWLCEKDVWIEDFAYGPCFNMLFSIKNDGDDTVAIRYDDIKLFLEYGRKMSRKKKEPILNFPETETILIIPPNSSVDFWGQAFFYEMDGEISIEMNYKFVNFLPDITRIIESAKVIIAIPGFEIMKASFKNCFTEKTLFRDGTLRESIFRYRN